MMSKDYPNNPGVRAGSPDTAQDAADSVADAAATRERKALALIRSKGLYGATADEVAESFGWHLRPALPALALHRTRGSTDAAARDQPGHRRTGREVHG